MCHNEISHEVQGFEGKNIVTVRQIYPNNVSISVQTFINFVNIKNYDFNNNSFYHDSTNFIQIFVSG